MTNFSREQGRIAAEFLLRARDDFERAERTRAVYARDAHSHGLTWGDIGSFLGVTARKARQIAGGA